jgi:hypothetical protein
MANAALEWQAGSLRWRSGELLVACPLEGLVRPLYYNHRTRAQISCSSKIEKMLSLSERWLPEGFDYKNTRLATGLGSKARHSSHSNYYSKQRWKTKQTSAIDYRIP